MMKTYKKLLFFSLCLLLPYCVIAKTISTNPKNPTINLNLQNISTRSALIWMAKYANKNIVLSPSVHGTVNLSLQNISWRQSLKLILKSQGLTQKNINGILYIAPSDEIDQKEKTVKPHQTSWIQLNYAKATEIAKILNSQKKYLFSQTGYLLIDEHTNSLLIKDNDNRIKEIRQIIQKLDIPIPQVLIEARIVNIDNGYENELGIKFGMTYDHHRNKSFQNATEITQEKSETTTKIKNQLNIDLPALSSRAGKIGFSLFKLDSHTLLDLELSALETEGRAEIISTPRLLTANQQTAYIEAGEEIPYQEIATQGATTTSFKKAVLSLQVTPHIIPNHKVLLHLKLNQDKRSSKEILGVPAVDTHQISTRVLVDDGQTLVLGGIYEQSKNQAVEKIPFISDLPLIGVLFQHKKMINNRRELLIFVTPKILS